MSRPLASDINDNLFAINGQPYDVAGVSAANSDTNQFASNGQPFNSPYSSGAQTVTFEEDLGTDDSSFLEAIGTPLEDDTSITDTDSLHKVGVSFEEDLSTQDSFTINATVAFEEDLGTQDSIQIFPISGEDLLAIDDTNSSILELELFLEDDLSTLDNTTVSEPAPVAEALDTLDSCVITEDYYVLIEEDLATTDLSSTAIAIVPIEEDLAMLDEVTTIADFKTPFSTKEEIAAIFTNFYSTAFTNLVSDFNDAVDVQSSSNPFLPTVIFQGGDVYVTNAESAPGSVPTDTNYVDFIKEDIVSGNDLCDLFNWVVNLDFEGGYFSIHSKNQIPVPECTIFGFPAQAFGGGEFINNANGAGYVTEGLLGSSIKLNRKLPLLELEAPLKKWLGARSISSINTPTSFIPVASGLAKAIATAVGINLSWATQDYKVMQNFPTGAFTPLEAINTLAARVGGVTVWSGKDQYTVIDLVTGLGHWQAPDCRLFGPNALEFVNIPDVISDTIFYPYNPLTVAADITFLDNQMIATQLDRVVKLGTFSTAPQQGANEYVMDLPADWVKAKIQVYNTDGSAMSSFLTSNSNTWFDLETRAAPGSHIRQALYGPQQVVLTSGDFPASGNFQLSIGYTRNIDGITQAYQKSLDMIQQIEALVDSGQQAVSYVPVQRGSANYIFHGTIPLPGMLTTITNPKTGNTLSGIIESVSINSPGFLTVNVAQYKKIELLRLFKPGELITPT